jgi:PAS domain-containing protein
MKDSSGRIYWINRFFSKVFGVSLVNVVGKPITDVLHVNAGQRETIEENIRQAVREKVPSFTIEIVGKMSFRAERFPFDKSMLGDVSFDQKQIREHEIEVDREVLPVMERRAAPGVERLFVPFVEAAPVAMAIKRPLEGDSLILWANDAFLQLTEKKAKDVFGRTTSQVFGLPREHRIFQNEKRVVTEERAYMGKEEVRPGMPRWSLRFPIFDAQGNVALLGVVSPDYQQKTAAPHFR